MARMSLCPSGTPRPNICHSSFSHLPVLYMIHLLMPTTPVVFCSAFVFCSALCLITSVRTLCTLLFILSNTLSLMLPANTNHPISLLQRLVSHYLSPNTVHLAVYLIKHSQSNVSLVQSSCLLFKLQHCTVLLLQI
jgi:hypothetical protein